MCDKIEMYTMLLTSTSHDSFYRFSRTNLGTQKTILGRNLISLLNRPLLKWNILAGSLKGWAGRKALYMTKKSLKLVVPLLVPCLYIEWFGSDGQRLSRAIVSWLFSCNYECPNACWHTPPCEQKDRCENITWTVITSAALRDCWY